MLEACRRREVAGRPLSLLPMVGSRSGKLYGLCMNKYRILHLYKVEDVVNIVRIKRSRSDCLIMFVQLNSHKLLCARLLIGSIGFAADLEAPPPTEGGL